MTNSTNDAATRAAAPQAGTHTNPYPICFNEEAGRRAIDMFRRIQAAELALLKSGVAIDRLILKTALPKSAYLMAYRSSEAGCWEGEREARRETDGHEPERLTDNEVGELMRMIDEANAEAAEIINLLEAELDEAADGARVSGR